MPVLTDIPRKRPGNPRKENLSGAIDQARVQLCEFNTEVGDQLLEEMKSTEVLTLSAPMLT